MAIPLESRESADYFSDGSPIQLHPSTNTNNSRVPLNKKVGKPTMRLLHCFGPDISFFEHGCALDYYTEQQKPSFNG
jgi:hypothetical protein